MDTHGRAAALSMAIATCKFMGSRSTRRLKTHGGHGFPPYAKAGPFLAFTARVSSLSWSLMTASVSKDIIPKAGPKSCLL